MLKRLGRLFVIKSRLEAMFVIYALAVGAVERGIHYMDQYPGTFGYLLFAACTGAVFMAGAKILDATPRKPNEPAGHSVQERRQNDRRSADRRQAPRERSA